MNKPLFYTSIDCSYNKIRVTGVSDNKRFCKEVDYQPSLYTISSKSQSKFNSINHLPLEQHKFKNVSGFFKFKKKYKDFSNVELFGDISPQYQFLYEHFYNKVQYDSTKINKVYFDIEVSSLTEKDKYEGFPEPEIAPVPIVSIQTYHSLYDKVIVYGLKDYDTTKSNHKACDIIYIKCSSEKELLLKFAEHISSQKLRPDILLGWNSHKFDMMYISNRLKLIAEIDGVSYDYYLKKLSPFHSISFGRKSNLIGGMYSSYECTNIAGVPHIDYIDLFRKFAGEEAQSMKLDDISERHLGQNKLSYGESKSIPEMYWNDHQRFIDYGIKDVYLLHMLDEQFGCIDIVFQMSFIMNCSVEDALGTVKPWDCKLYCSAKDRGQEIPPKPQGEKEEGFKGGFVREPKIGISRWVTFDDYTSLYPRIIYSWNMSPETLLYQREDDCTISPNGQFFSKRSAILADEVNDNFNKRVEYKRLRDQFERGTAEYKKYDTLQYIFKVLINSAYGAIGSPSFRYYKRVIAESITLTGQDSIKKSANAINSKINQLLGTEDIDYSTMGDTDSYAYYLGDLVERDLPHDASDQEKLDYVNKIYNDHISPTIKKITEEIHTQGNVKFSGLELEKEIVAKSVICVAKKHYIALIMDNEGKNVVGKDKLKVRGMLSVKRDTPKFFRKKLEEAYLLFLKENKEGLKKFIIQTKRQYKSMDPVDVAKPIKISNLNSKVDYSSKTFYGKGVHYFTKSALVYNHYLKRFNLHKKYNLIRPDDNVKLIRLKEGNPFGERYLSFPDDMLPTALCPKEFIDYDSQFESFFMTEIQAIADTLKWDVKPRKTRRLF